MSSTELPMVAEAVIASIKPGILGDEAVQILRSLFPDTLILAALDLVDRDSVIKYTAPWGRSHYEVLGSTATYVVFPRLSSSPTPVTSTYCTCPAFTYAVLISDSHLMCKHVLATRLAEQMTRCLTRPISKDDLASIIVRQNLG
ncbi:hypothetical protein PILCRDRAFT_819463 [Piloderma croceum F 1598]|uniref:SWIM-type domain-containing protein n=1 Tax=Piloderma croceum (strain F 1598) TaxID=765440 RepID=A0A0C3C0Y1_PILCF|nr:hypothetical protein PILCRDRAFT_819463 [Piloderma croceum F 1598]